MCINYISKINKLNEDLSKIKIRSYECIHYLYQDHRKLDKEEKQKLEKSIQSLNTKVDSYEEKMNHLLLVFEVFAFICFKHHQKIKKYITIGVDVPQRISHEIEILVYRFP